MKSLKLYIEQFTSQHIRKAWWADFYAVVTICILGIGAFGWLSNIVKLSGSDLTTLTGMLIVRTVGVFMFPVGCVAGYF